MNEIKIFENEDFGQIRTTMIDNEPWFVGKDVAEILGYAKPRNAISRHIDEEDKKDAPIQGDLGGIQEMTIINESGLYSLILSSKLPRAKDFKHWVTSEVLPAIRQTGGYVTPQKLEDIFTNPDNLSVFLNQMLVINEENRKLRNNITELEPKANYFDKLINKSLLVNFRTTAKELGIGQKEFVEFLLDNKYLYRDTKDKLQPFRKCVAEGLFEIKEFCRNGHAGTQTYLTAKGRSYFLKLLKND